LFQNPENAAPHQRTHRRCGNYHPAPFLSEQVTLLPASTAIQSEAARIPKGFKERMKRGIEDA
jgi:hypothetical protein